MTAIPFRCPHCRHDLLIPDDVWHYSCDFCRENLDLKSQFAFLRGMEAFDEGQDLMVDKGPRKPRGKTRDNATYKHVLDLFVEAYSALQIAFMGKLVEVQRQVGVEMMASMSAEFFLQNMISPLEVHYWGLIKSEQTAQMEIDRLKQNLNRSDLSKNLLARVHAAIRIRQLKKKLAAITEKLKLLEEQIEFVDAPRARNKSWTA